MDYIYHIFGANEGLYVIKNIINKLRLDLISSIPGHQAIFHTFNSDTNKITEYKYIIYKPNDFSAIITKTQNDDLNKFISLFD